MKRWLVICCVVFSAAFPLGASAATGPTTSFDLSSTAASLNARVRVNLCWSNAPAKAAIALERQRAGASAWAVVIRRAITREAGCVATSTSVDAMGHFLYRTQVVIGRRALRTSAVRSLYAYGTISANSLFFAQFGCGSSTATVSDGVNSYQYFCQLSAGRTSTQPSEAVFKANTSCRSLTLRLLGTDNAPGDIGDTSIDSLNLTQSTLSPHPVSFNANTVTTATFALDGSPATLQTWNNRGDFNESVYVLSTGSSASCWTPTGVAP